MSDNADDDARLKDRGLEVDAWEAEAPPRDFTDRVMRAVMDERRHEREEPPAETARPSGIGPRRARWIAAGVAACAAAAAMVALVSRAPREGALVARERTEVSIGGRAIAVLEPGARVEWKGDDVVQAAGDIFYRVEPGARFVVHTPAGDAEVKGTCFAVKVRGGESNGRDAANEDDMAKRDLKAGAVGAVITAAAFVAVYEGRVAVSHAGQRAELGAGESASLGEDGVRRASGDVASASSAFEEAAAKGATPGDAVASANENLVGQVRAYKDELAKIQSQKTELEKKLEQSQARLAAAQDGAPARLKSEFDLTQDDWAELAKKGTIKYRMPCSNKEGWSFPQDKLDKLGLAPGDAATLRDAYDRSHKRVWAEIRPLCIQALGSAEAVDKIGLNTCTHLVYDVAAATDRAAAEEQRILVAEMRAGLKPPPGADDRLSPVTKLFWTLTGAHGAFEADLAKSFGPEEAHRLAYSDEMCNSDSTWGGRRKR